MQKIKIKKMKKTYATAILIVYSMTLTAQRGFDSDMDKEDSKEFDRYAHLDLSTGEVISILIGVALLIVAKSMNDMNENLRIGIGCIGVLFAIPLFLVILAVAQKAIAYAILLVSIIGTLYFIFGKK